MNPLDFLFDKTVIFFVANTLYVISYMLTSMIWLRLLAVIAAACTFPYFFFQEQPLWSALFWQSMFLGVNLINLVALLISMRSAKLSAMEQDLHENLFKELKRQEVVPIFRAGKTIKISKNQSLLQDGQPNSDLYLIVDGGFDVLTGAGKKIAEIGRYEFAGEMSYISKSVASASVVAREHSTVIRWRSADLEALFNKSSLYKPYLYQLWSVHLSSKLRTMTRAADPAYSVPGANIPGGLVS